MFVVRGKPGMPGKPAPSEHAIRAERTYNRIMTAFKPKKLDAPTRCPHHQKIFEETIKININTETEITTTRSPSGRALRSKQKQRTVTELTAEKVDAEKKESYKRKTILNVETEFESNDNAEALPHGPKNKKQKTGPKISGSFSMSMSSSGTSSTNSSSSSSSSSSKATQQETSLSKEEQETLNEIWASLYKGNKKEKFNREKGFNEFQKVVCTRPLALITSAVKYATSNVSPHYHIHYDHKNPLLKGTAFHPQLEFFRRLYIVWNSAEVKAVLEKLEKGEKEFNEMRNALKNPEAPQKKENQNDNFKETTATVPTGPRFFISANEHKEALAKLQQALGRMKRQAENKTADARLHQDMQDEQNEELKSLRRR